MTPSSVLFEVSWEVANRVGGLHSVLASKARSAVAHFGDDYIMVGPLRQSDSDREVPLDPDSWGDAFCQFCKTEGLEVRAGRLRIEGRPRCLLVDFSKLYDQKDDLLSQLWEEFEVDSLQGDWDYIEPVLFAHAAGSIIDEYWQRHLADKHQRATVIAHEWQSAAALLRLQQVPAIAKVFAAHSTAVGRAHAALGNSLDQGLDGASADSLAEDLGVKAQHSLERQAIERADVFTAVSPIVRRAAEILHERSPDFVVPNGIDTEVLDRLAESRDGRDANRARLQDFAHRFFGTNVDDAFFVATAGRYEFHNKGFDVLLEAMAQLDRNEGRPIVLLMMVPTGTSGLRADVRDRLQGAAPSQVQDPLGLTTHHLFDEDQDTIRSTCHELGLTNQTGSRVKILHVPVYSLPGDQVFDRHYEALVAACDAGAFPSFYDPWGSAAQESLALGVPTVSTDCSGFGLWARDHEIGAEQGLHFLERSGKNHGEVVDELASMVRTLIDAEPDTTLRSRSQDAAKPSSWADLHQGWVDVCDRALESVTQRSKSGESPRRRRRGIVKHSPEVGSKPRLTHFDVTASLPAALAPLARLAKNFYWCWDLDAPSLFRELDEETWVETHHNPVTFLRQVDPDALQKKAGDSSFTDRVKAAAARFDAYLESKRETLKLDDPSLEEFVPKAPSDASIDRSRPIAYFCAEYGLHESLPIYSGGLGVLAGDHLKSSSDLNLPFVAVGLFYQFGYMKQQLTVDGQQIAVDRENVPNDLAVEPVRRDDGSLLEIRMPFLGRDLTMRAFRVDVGRTPLYLLSTDCPQNDEEDRLITRNLYGGDHETRIRQLIVLGRGGVRLLQELDLEPSAFHMNEGHAAFLTLERVSHLVKQKGLSFEAAREFVRASTAFTTHTPVPAGHDRFGEDLVRRYFSDVESWLGVPWERFLRLGRATDEADDVNMTYLALSFSSFVNGVSQMHGEVSRELLHEYWPSLLEAEVPVDGITNGIHLRTWTAPSIQSLVRSDSSPAFGSDFESNGASIDRKALWAARHELKCVLGKKIEERVRNAFVSRNDSPVLMAKMLEALDTDALWIGFARRFAPYKRSGLLYSDVERLRAILDDTDRPVRILVAGKAHPKDTKGQDILKNIAQLARGDELIGRVLFLEDYDMDLARALVQGVDVWLNNPTHTLEASGTSGMKASANGGLNFSIADGWWPEIADGKNGWTIGGERVYDDQELQNELDGSTIYRMLEDEIAPLYFDRDADGIPQGWMDHVVHNLESVPPFFDTDRMVTEYLHRAYAPLALGTHEMTKDPQRAQTVAGRAQEIRRGFSDVKILEVRMPELSSFQVGETLSTTMRVDLGPLSADDIVVELVLGLSGRGGEPMDAERIRLEAQDTPDGSIHEYRGEHVLTRSGRYSQGLRVRPRRLSSSPSSLRDLSIWA